MAIQQHKLILAKIDRVELKAIGVEELYICLQCGCFKSPFTGNYTRRDGQEISDDCNVEIVVNILDE